MDLTQRQVFFPVWLCANALVDIFILKWPWQIALAEQLFIVLAWAFEGRRKQDSENARETPPLEYRGPFWNKPTVAYLEREAHPFSLTQSRIAGLLLLVPFGVLFYLLLH